MPCGNSANNDVHLQGNCKSDAAKKVVKSPPAREQDPHIPPKTIWENYQDFRKFKLPSFRAFLNREKAKLGNFCEPPRKKQSAQGKF